MRNPLGLFSKIFAGSADPSEREEFVDFEAGWDSDYSTAGSGKKPRRKIFNDLFAKLFALCVDINQYGGALPWDTNISYKQFAVTTGSDGELYRSKADDNSGNDPVLDDGTNWELAAVTVSVLSEHTEDTDNPHAVTAAQVGLGFVDNTADENKPVSTPQQEALDLKCDKSEEVYAVSGAETLREIDFTDMADLTLAEQMSKVTSVLATLISDMKSKGDFQ
jgi:hypothetical protein